MSGPFSRRLWTRLLRVIEQLTPRRGRFARLRHTQDGVVVSGTGGGRGDGETDHPWEIEIDDGEEGEMSVRFNRGLIAGREPTIETKPISKEDEKTGERPALTVSEDQFDADGICRIYVKVTFDSAWLATAAVIVAAAKTPPAAARTAHVLLALLVRDAAKAVTVEPRAFRDLTIIPAERHSNGFATYLVGIAK